MRKLAAAPSVGSRKGWRRCARVSSIFSLSEFPIRELNSNPAPLYGFNPPELPRQTEGRQRRKPRTTSPPSAACGAAISPDSRTASSRAGSFGLAGWFGSCGSGPSCRTSVSPSATTARPRTATRRGGPSQKLPTPAFKLKFGPPRICGAAPQRSYNRLLF